MTDTTKRIIIMLCAVLLMGGALLLLTLPEDETIVDTGSDYSEDVGDENELLIDRSTLDLTEVVLTNSYGTFTIREDDEGELYINELSDIPLNTYFLEVLWYDVTSIGFSYSFMLTEHSSATLADYGLEPAQATFTSRYADGTGNTMRIGYAAGSDSDSDSYYFQLDDDPYVYITTLDYSFFLGDNYWISDDMFGSSYEGDADITRIAIDLVQEGKNVVIEPNSATDKSSPCYDYDYVLTSPELCAADDYFMTTLIDELSWLTAYEAVKSHPTQDDLAGYGLDAPYAILDVTRNGSVHHLTLSRYDYNTLYATVNDIPVIWQIDASSNEALASLSFSSLRSTDVHICYYDAIESFTVIYGGNEYVFRTERTAVNDSDTLYEYSSYYGDQHLALSDIKAMLEVFNSAASSDYTDSVSDDEPYMTVIIDYFDSYENSRDMITYTENGTRRYLCRINGVGTANVTAMWIEKFISSVEALASGKTVTP